MPEYTEEQIKEAQEQVSAAKQRGFINHLVVCGKSASEVQKMHNRYVQDDAKRQAHLDGLRLAILGENAA
jgi:tRNA A37 threonylcarbamoyladenosine synthetase subunit TsaC/SUA5/YrdC